MNKYVIYSALVGAYDAVFQPEVVDERFDFVLFTNEVKEDRLGVWMVRPIPYQNQDTTRVARYVKTHPESLLPGYEASVWMDMNVRIKTGYLYERVAQLAQEGVPVSSMNHHTYDCIYDEAFSVMHLRIERESVVVRWCHRLCREQYPVHNGLCETNVLYRKHEEIVNAFDELWWSCIDCYSRRDQLSFNYALWKTGILCHYLMGEDTCARNTEHFEVVVHKNRSHNFCDLGKNEGWLMRYCWKVPSKKEEVKETYFRLYAKPMPVMRAFLLGQFYRVKYLLTKK